MSIIVMNPEEGGQNETRESAERDWERIRYRWVVVYKKAFDANSRGRSVHIGFLRKVISQKSKIRRKKLIYMKKAGGY